MTKRTVGPVTQAATAGAGAGAAAGAMFLPWLLAQFGIDMPAGVAAAAVVLLTLGAGALGGWLVKPGTGQRRA